MIFHVAFLCSDTCFISDCTIYMYWTNRLCLVEKLAEVVWKPNNYIDMFESEWLNIHYLCIAIKGTWAWKSAKVCKNKSRFNYDEKYNGNQDMPCCGLILFLKYFRQPSTMWKRTSWRKFQNNYLQTDLNNGILDDCECIIPFAMMMTS